MALVENLDKTKTFENVSLNADGPIIIDNSIKTNWVYNSPTDGLFLENLGICVNIFSLPEEKFRKQLVFTATLFHYFAVNGEYDAISQFTGNKLMPFDGKTIHANGKCKTHSFQIDKRPECSCLDTVLKMSGCICEAHSSQIPEGKVSLLFIGALAKVRKDLGLKLQKPEKPLDLVIDPILCDGSTMTFNANSSVNITHNGTCVNNTVISTKNGEQIYTPIEV